MQTGTLLFKKILLCLTLLAFLTDISWAASSFKTAPSGFCCVNNILKESTEKQCEKYRGTFYSINEKTKSQKECRSAKHATPAKIGIPPKIPRKSEVPGFCCVNGIVKKATKGQCSKMKGSYSQSNTKAKQNCKPKKIFCCVDGKVSAVSSGECKKRKGTAYKSVAEARKKCKPANVYCCVEAKITKISSQRCKQHKGTAYKSATEAKQKCKAPDIYCNVNNTVRKMSSKQCRSKKGKEFKTKTEAEKVSRQQKNRRNALLLQRMNAAKKAHPEQNKVTGTNNKVGKIPAYGKPTTDSLNGYCCTNGKVSLENKKGCVQKKGLFFKSRISAEKICRAQKTGSLAATKNGGPNVRLLQGMSAATIVQPGLGKVTGVNTQVGGIGETVRRDGQALADIETMRTCKVSGWVAINGLAPSVPVSLQLTPTGGDGQSQRQSSFRLALNGSFSLNVLPGSYRLQPLFSITSDQHEQISIPANEFVCQPDWSSEFTSTFNWPETSSSNTTPPPMCVLSGRIVNEHGTGTHEITGVEVFNTNAGSSKAANYHPDTASYQVEIPAGSSYRLEAVFEEGSRLGTVNHPSFRIREDQTTESINVVVNRGQQLCNISGTILVDGSAPVELLSITVTPTGEGVVKHYNTNGSFSFTIPEGHHWIEPFFPTGSVYGESIPAKEIICQVDLAENISLDFSHTSPPVCMLTGRVNAYGSGVSSLTLRSLAPGGETIPVAVSGAAYRVEIPWGASYILTPNVDQGASTPESKEFTIYPGQRSHVVDFELNSTVFRFTRFKVLGFERNHQIEDSPTQVKFVIRTIVRGGEESYNRIVRITSPENHQININRDCVFTPEGRCEFTLALDGVNVQTDSIHAEILGREDEPTVEKTWTTPFRWLRGDLAVNVVNYFVLKYDGETSIQFSMQNVNTAAASEACSVYVKLNGVAGKTFQIPALPAGGEHRIRYENRTWAPRVGDLLSFQIDDNCDSYTNNNRELFRIAHDRYGEYEPGTTIMDVGEDIIDSVEDAWDYFF